MQCSFCNREVQSFDGLCPSCHKALGAAPAKGLIVTGAQRVMSREEAAMVDQKPTIIQPPVSKDDGGAMKFRPRLRPPMLLLCVWDDDGQDGQNIRIYGDRFAIGRSEGDLILPHDTGISSRHLELVREPVPGRWIWKLRDLGSTNGTFVRIDAGPLHHGQVLLIGSGRYRFQCVAQGGRQTETGQNEQNQVTQQWRVPRLEDIAPTLVRLAPDGGEQSMVLPQAKEHHLGSDAAACQLRVADDPWLDRRHARIYSTGQEQWAIQDLQSTNGVWTMIHEVVIEDTLQFQAGEQRFLARVP